ncbi:UDP-N-acetylmuramate dehydrogenase [Metabacillus sp. B2-18]|uniref:UDP-N-acetylmuramate dehydrogenase n=1 Tax=Metabacillus sp. B2-18 TaxID=2897333 RepID=UPI001E5B5BA1|nr:UDP-N-acetylmuramate dehydrogenase [Metabacillus sp. B2-18]UGB32070.1 UDP-N-acetylmuramate dehydrogenase [Metabacillus sp. B2-18]
MSNLVYMKSLLKDVLETKNIKFYEPIKKYTFTKLGGEADILITPSTHEQIQLIYKKAKENKVPITIIGNGTNLIVKDSGIEGLVISLKKLNEVKVKDRVITAQAGANIIDVSRMALNEKLSGLEFACGIPGTVGGALCMNAGAYGGQISDVLKKALVLTESGELLVLEKEALLLGYRKSIVSQNNYVVLQAEFELQYGQYDQIKGKMDENTRLREQKQPLEYPSCGSVFKRPPGYYAGKLIQDSGLQGLRIGGAEVSRKHAGFIVNVDHATAKDYVELIQVIKKTVKEKYGVDLETEVIVIGKEDEE